MPGPMLRLPPRQLRRSGLTAGLLGLMLSIGAAVAPPAAINVAPFLAAFDAPRAFAADDIAIRTAARYTVVPDKGVVRVSIDVTATNAKPNKVTGGVITRYFYDGVNLGVQPEATHFRATQDGSPATVTADRREAYRLVTILFRTNIFFQQQARVRLTFDLPAGKPRSSSDVRVGPAFASFLAWAFGDTGTVRVDIPRAFKVDLSGAALERSTGDTGVQVYTATTTDPGAWFAWVNARNDDGLTRQRLALANGEQVVVRAWPEDTGWRKRVATILGDGIPQLTRRIGLPWPVDGALSVLEIHTPLLEGYAGFYNPATDEIRISEDLDDVTIVHEASHAWFNQHLFTERWITEGLAEEYASQVVDAIGGDAPGPGKAPRSAKAAFPLNAWPPPAPIADDKANARERYGYDAAFRVIRQVVRGVGAEGMRKVFAAADSKTTAYPGSVDPEPTTLPNDWRRFLDLTEGVGGATGVAALLRTWALTDQSAALLAPRATARAAYRELVTNGDGWAAPVVVRMAMDAWQYDEAVADIGAASDVLAARDDIATAADAAGLDAPDGLEAAYERARAAGDLVSVAQDAATSRQSLAEVASAAAAAAAPRDWLVGLGLVGKAPDADLVAARAAWEAGDFTTATATATLVVGTLHVAPDAGRGRALVIGGGLGLVLLLIVAVGLGRRRASQARGRVVASAAAAAVSAATALADPTAAGSLNVDPASADPASADPAAAGDPAADAAAGDPGRPDTPDA